MPDTPPVLGTEALRLWGEVNAVYQLRPDERRLLEDACREIDLIEQMQSALPKDKRELTTRGSMGQAVSHPLIGELRQHRMTLAGLLKQIKLTDVEPSKNRDATETETAAREAAHTRWGRRA